jgi:predicted RNA binding protein YcfA (HicA-like mRNA interferase family)
MVAIFVALGFHLVRTGKHACYERDADAIRSRSVVPIDDYDEFEETLIKSMISQSGFDRSEFYGSTKASAKKINIKTLFKPCSGCGRQIGSTNSCKLCLGFLKSVSS